MEQNITYQDRSHLERMINMLSDNLKVYEEQAAAFGELYVPPFLVRQINETKSEILKLQEQIRQYKTSLNSEENEIPKVPHNLPSQLHLIDRIDEITTIKNVLEMSSINIVIIEGVMGTGKTALASSLANNLWETGQFKGAVWISAENGTLTLNSMIDTLATIMDYPNLVRLSGEEKILSATNILRSQKTLIIIDGYEKVENDNEIVGFIYRIPSSTKVIITRNKRGESFNNSYVLSLKGLDMQFMIDLVAHECDRLNIKGVDKLPEKILRQLHELTSGNPYAIKLSIGQIKRFGLTFDSILSKLNSAQGQLFEHIYNNSWGALKEDQRQILKAISILGGSTSLLALQEITKMPFWDLESNLAELIEMSLVETNAELEREKIRYGILSLTRTYVLNALEGETELRNNLMTRASDYYLDYCVKYKKVFPNLQKELENLRIVMEWCKVERRDMYIQLTRLLYPFFRDVGYWQDALSYINHALKIITEDDGRAIEAGWLSCELASIYIRVGGEKELDSAYTVLENAERIFEKNPNIEGLCAVYGRQARVAHKRKDYQTALNLGLNALNLAKEKNLVTRIADIQHEIGDTYRVIGDLEAAKAHYEESLKIYQSLNDPIRVAGRLNDLGYLALHDMRPLNAKALFLESIELCEQNDKKDTLTRALNGLALVEDHLNFPLKAYHSAIRAKQIAIRLGAINESQQATEIEKKMGGRLADQNAWLFNFNNTLADTYTLNVEAWVLACHHFGYDVHTVDLEEELKQGASSSQITSRLGIGGEKENEVVKLKRSIFRDNALKELRLYPDVYDVFLELKTRGNIISIISLMPEAIIMETIKRAQLSDVVDKIVGMETVSDKQNNITAKYRAAELVLEYIPIDKSRFTAIGDSQEEHDVSRRLGIKYIHYPRLTSQNSIDKYPGSFKFIKTLNDLLSE